MVQQLSNHNLELLICGSVSFGPLHSLSSTLIVSYSTSLQCVWICRTQSATILSRIACWILARYQHWVKALLHGLSQGTPGITYNPRMGYYPEDADEDTMMWK